MRPEQRGNYILADRKQVSKKQQACVTRYIAAHNDRLSITVPQGMKDTIASAAKALYGSDGSVNGFVNAAIAEKLARMS